MNHFINYRNLRFLLFDMLGADTLCQHAAFADFDRDAFEMSLDAAKQIAETHLFPFYVEMDRKKAYFQDGIVHTHPQLKVLIEAIGEGGWISATMPTEYGGMNMPQVLSSAALLTEM